MEHNDAVDAAMYSFGPFTTNAGEYVVGPAANSAITSARHIGATLTNKGKPVAIRPFEAAPTEAMLVDKSSPYNIDPETLANLWVVRFGKEWVGTELIANTDAETVFWQHATNRLRELGYLEMHTLASSYRVVLRIVE